MKHKFYDVIVAAAEDKTIQVKFGLDSPWVDFKGHQALYKFDWNLIHDARIKPLYEAVGLSNLLMYSKPDVESFINQEIELGNLFLPEKPSENSSTQKSNFILYKVIGPYNAVEIEISELMHRKMPYNYFFVEIGKIKSEYLSQEQMIIYLHDNNFLI